MLGSGKEKSESNLNFPLLRVRVIIASLFYLPMISRVGASFCIGGCGGNRFVRLASMGVTRREYSSVNRVPVKKLFDQTNQQQVQPKQNRLRKSGVAGETFRKMPLGEVDVPTTHEAPRNPHWTYKWL